MVDLKRLSYFITAFSSVSKILSYEISQREMIELYISFPFPCSGTVWKRFIFPIKSFHRLICFPVIKGALLTKRINV